MKRLTFIVQYAEEDQVTEKVISMSLDLVHFNEVETYLLIDSLLQEESEENVKTESSTNTTLEVSVKTDYPLCIKDCVRVCVTSCHLTIPVQ